MDWREFADGAWTQSLEALQPQLGPGVWLQELTPVLFREFIRVAWYASMATEESRYHGPRLVLGSSARPSIQFGEPIAYDERALAKLSPLAEEGLRQLVVQRCGGRLCLVGLRDPFFRYRRWLTHRPEFYRPDRHLLLRIVAPGHVRLGYPVEQELQRGRRHFLTPLWKVASLQQWFGEAGTYLDERTRAQPRAPGALAVQRIWTEILRWVDDAERGGAFLIVPEGPAAWEPVLRIASTHRGETSLLQDALREMREIEPSLPDYARVSERHSARLINMAHFHERDLELAAQMVASLTQVDGAVVFSKSLRLLAFGAMITAGTWTDVREVSRHDGREEVLEWEERSLHGMRHQSAIDFVAAVPGSLAIVVSEDGDISVFSRQGDYVAFERVTLNEDWHDVEG